MKFIKKIKKEVILVNFVLSALFPVLVLAKSEGGSEDLKTFSSTEPHEVVLLNSGIASFQQRLLAIEEARESIDIEYFIYQDDLSSRIFTNALIKKANEGVKIRILIDATPFMWKIKEYHAKILSDLGIEVKFYNDVSVVAKPMKSQHRNHRKLMVIDESIAILGGRNIADRYFDVEEYYNFLDRDVFVRGSMVKKIKKNFEVFWNHQLSEVIIANPPRPQEYGFTDEIEATNDPIIVDDLSDHRAIYLRNEYKMSKQRYAEKIEDAKKLITLSSKDLQMFEEMKRVGTNELNRQFHGTCRDNHFFGDLPGRGAKERISTEFVKDFFQKTEKSLSMESAYFTLDSKDKLFQILFDKKIKIQLLSNSLNSTDDVIVGGAFFKTIGDFVKKGVRAYVYEGKTPESIEFVPGGGQFARWGLHAKGLVADQKHSVVMSYNIDPRSDNLNSELGFACFDYPELASALQEDINLRLKNSVELNEKGEFVDGRSKYVQMSGIKIILTFIARPFAEIFSFLL